MVLQRCLVVFIASFLIFGCKEKAYQPDENHNKTVQNSRYSNPVIPGDFADPSVLVDGTYYAVGTSLEWAPHFPIYNFSRFEEINMTTDPDIEELAK